LVFMLFIVSTCGDFASENGISDGDEAASLTGGSSSGGAFLTSNMNRTHAAYLLKKNYNWDILYRSPEELADSLLQGGGDLLLLIGIICSMSPEDSVRCLGKIKQLGKSDCEILITTLSSLAFEENPKVFKVFYHLGWHLKPKTEKEMKAIATESNWHEEWMGSERRDIHNGREIPGEYMLIHARNS